MLNIFKSRKSNRSEREEVFKLGKYQFLIDKSESIIDIENNKIIDLTVKTSETEFEQLSELEGFEFSWALYSPEFYARGVNFDKQKKLTVEYDDTAELEIALYFMEHNSVKVGIVLKHDCVSVIGLVDLFGEEYPLEIFLRY